MSARLYLSWHTSSMDATLVLGQQGRVVIPADIRSALGLAPGDRLHLQVTGQRLVLERQQDRLPSCGDWGLLSPRSARSSMS